MGCGLRDKSKDLPCSCLTCYKCRGVTATAVTEYKAALRPQDPSLIEACHSQGWST